MPNAQGSESKSADARVVIKKYANRRLYNTASSSYVTLEHLSEMVKKGTDFVVYDAKSNDDITRSVLTQIIFDEENRDGAANLLPIQFLRQLIRFYGDSMQALVPSYLELSLDSFTKQQDRMRSQMTETMGGAQGMRYFEDHVRQNMQLFDRAMKMFSPFAFGGQPEGAATASPTDPATPAPSAGAASTASPDTLEAMKQQLSAMQQQLEKLASKS